MPEGEEREWLSDGNIIRLLLGVVGFLCAMWLYSQQGKIDSLAKDVGDIRVSVSGVPKLQGDIDILREDGKRNTTGLAALQKQADDTDRMLDALAHTKQMNRLEEKYRKKVKQDTITLELQQKHADNESRALTELYKRRTVGP